MSSPSHTTVRAVRHTAVRFDTATFSTLPFVPSLRLPVFRIIYVSTTLHINFYTEHLFNRCILPFGPSRMQYSVL